MIEVENLRKSFGGVVALQGVSLQVAEGEFLTLVGPNGAGKTTLMRILATLSRPTSGRVRVAGLDLRAGAEYIRQRIGLVSHQPLLYGDLTAEENLLFYGRMYGVPNLEQRITEVLRQVGLLARRADPVRTFSRGMQQRLSIARAIIHDPPVLLLDEPFTGLDQRAAAMLTRVLTDVGTRSRTVLMTTHDLERGLSLGDRVAILARGQVVHQVKREEVDVEALREVYLRVTESTAIR